MNYEYGSQKDQILPTNKSLYSSSGTGTGTGTGSGTGPLNTNSVALNQ